MKTKSAVINDSETLEEVLSCLAKNIHIDTQGKCDQQTIFEILIRAASERDSIENTCKMLEAVPCGNDIRYHLEKLDSMNKLEYQLNETLHSRIPPGIRKGKILAAIDLNLIPYYGTPNDIEKPYIYRSEAKDGTCSFYAYASIYLIKKHKRVTIALTSVQQDDTNVAIITRLLDKISPLNLRIKRLLLDRGFYSVPVIRWLKALDIPFIMPVIVRGKDGGTAQLLKGGRSYKTTYTMQSQKYGSVSFEVRVVCVYKNGKRGKHGIEYFAYAVHKISLTLQAIHDDYRRRFGIETSYRMKNQCRIKTTSKNPVIRLLFMGIAFILTDIWVYLCWMYISLPRKGGRKVFPNQFPLKRMLIFLRQAIEQRHPIINSVYLK